MKIRTDYWFLMSFSGDYWTSYYRTRCAHDLSSKTIYEKYTWFSLRDKEFLRDERSTLYLLHKKTVGNSTSDRNRFTAFASYLTNKNSKKKRYQVSKRKGYWFQPARYNILNLLKQRTIFKLVTSFYKEPYCRLLILSYRKSSMKPPYPISPCPPISEKEILSF